MGSLGLDFLVNDDIIDFHYTDWGVLYNYASQFFAASFLDNDTLQTMLVDLDPPIEEVVKGIILQYYPDMTDADVDPMLENIDGLELFETII